MIVADARLTKPCPNRRKADRKGAAIVHRLRVTPLDMAEFDIARTKACRVYCTCGLLGPLAPDTDTAIREWNEFM
jgi:hypothetical protein